METAVINSVVRLISEEALALVVLLALIFQLFYMNKAIERVEKAVSRLKEDIEALERKKVDKEVHLQDVSGWRWEIQRLFLMKVARSLCFILSVPDGSLLAFC